jgi:hypothetical protein
MTERFDSKVHEVVEYRLPKKGDRYALRNGMIQTALSDHDDEGDVEQPIVRRKPEPLRDVCWAAVEMLKNPGTAYECDEMELMTRYDLLDGFQSKRPDQTEWKTWNVFTDAEMKSVSWRPVPAAPAEGSREWAKAQPEGTLLWCSSCRSVYFRREGSGVRCVNVLDGKDYRHGVESIEADDWSLCLHHSVPSEPVVGSQHWAQVVCRELGKEVTDNTTTDPGYFTWDKTISKFRWHRIDSDYTCIPETGCRILVDHDWCQSGWSIHEPAAAKPAAAIHSVETLAAEVAAVVARVDALERIEKWEAIP